MEDTPRADSGGTQGSGTSDVSKPSSIELGDKWALLDEEYNQKFAELANRAKCKVEVHVKNYRPAGAKQQHTSLFGSVVVFRSGSHFNDGKLAGYGDEAMFFCVHCGSLIDPRTIVMKEMGPKKIATDVSVCPNPDCARLLSLSMVGKSDMADTVSFNASTPMKAAEFIYGILQRRGIEMDADILLRRYHGSVKGAKKAQSEGNRLQYEDMLEDSHKNFEPVMYRRDTMIADIAKGADPVRRIAALLSA